MPLAFTQEDFLVSGNVFTYRVHGQPNANQMPKLILNQVYLGGGGKIPVLWISIHHKWFEGVVFFSFSHGCLQNG